MRRKAAPNSRKAAPKSSSASKDKYKSQTVDQSMSLQCLPVEILLEVISHLNCCDLSRLRRTSKGVGNFVEPFLYKKSIAGDSKCIYHSSTQRSTDEATIENKRNVLRLAVQYGADVNATMRISNEEMATALYLAASCGMAHVVEDLIRYKARPDIVGCTILGTDLPFVALSKHGIDIDAQFDNEASYIILHSTQKDIQWFPMLIPICMKQHAIVKMLYEAGAPARLNIERHPGLVEYSLSIYHVIAAMKEFVSLEKQYYDMYCDMMTRHISDISIKFMRKSPLHFAIKHCNLAVAQKILDMGVGADVNDGAYATPLAVATGNLSHFSTLRRRNMVFDAVNMLIAKGADVNFHIGNRHKCTPLVSVMHSLPLVSKSYNDIESMIGLLVEHGADINGRSFGGDTLLHMTCRHLRDLESTSCPRFRKLLAFIVSQGADLNMPFSGRRNRTIMYYGILHVSKMHPSNFKALWTLGATIAPYEADDVLLRWIRQPALRNPNSGYAILKYHPDWISPAAYWNGLKDACFSEDKDIFRQLIEVFVPKDASELVAITFFQESQSLFDEVCQLPWRADYKWDNGMSFLHIVARRLVDYPKYTQKKAVDHANFFIRAGASTLATDDDDVGVIKMVRELPESYPNLLLTLYNAREIELDEMERGANAASEQKQ